MLFKIHVIYFSDIQLSEEMPINEEYLEEEYLEMFANEDAEIVVKP